MRRNTFASIFLGVGLAVSSTACLNVDDYEDPGWNGPPPVGEVNDHSPQGGEVRFTHMVWQPGQGTDNADKVLRVTGFFMNSMTPDSFSIPPRGECTNLTNGQWWPNAQGTNREYLDVGDLIISGGPNPLTVPLGGNGGSGTDTWLRTHDHFHLFIEEDVNDQYVPAGGNAHYDVTFTGSQEVPPVTYEKALYLPPEFDLVNPGLEPVDISAADDFNISWTQPEKDIPDADDVFTFIAFGVSGVGVTHLCSDDVSGQFTVPKEVLQDIASIGKKGSLLRGKSTLRTVELVTADGPTGRRIDLVANFCYSTPFTIITE